MSSKDHCPWQGFVYHLTRCDRCRAIARAAGWLPPPNPVEERITEPHRFDATCSATTTGDAS